MTAELDAEQIADAIAQANALAAELALRDMMGERIRGDMFDRQLALYDDKALWKAAHPGRRAGKSEYIPRGAALDLVDAGFEEVVLIGAETQKKAKALHWYKTLRVLRKAGVPFEANRTDGTIRTPWGASIVFWGINDEGAVDLIRGFKLKSAYFDECMSYATLLKYLTEDVVGPALEDTGGSMTLCGTPSLTRSGQWFKICKGSEKHRWSVHHWTLLDNPRFPRDRQAVWAAAAARYGHTAATPSATFLREYGGQFTDDPGMQVYKYQPALNDHQGPPAHYERATWAHTVAVDFGFTNACAWSVLTSAPHSKDVYVLCSLKQVGLLTDQAALVTAQLCESHQPERLVGDFGGLGKSYSEEWNQRYAGKALAEIEYMLAAFAALREGREQPKKPAVHPDAYRMPIMHAADKQAKRAGIDFVNNELGAPRIYLCQPACEPLSEELLSLPWADDTKQKEKAGYENHCSDTLLYGEKAHMAYLNEAPEKKTPKDARLDPDSEEYKERELEQLRSEKERDWWDEQRSDAQQEWWDRP